MFTRKITGWRNQELSQNLAFGTIEGRERLVTRFQESTNEYPWQWTTIRSARVRGHQHPSRHCHKVGPVLCSQVGVVRFANDHFRDLRRRDKPTYEAD